MKQVLFIAYQFPPYGGGGVQRTSKFVKYLPAVGWQATVVTGRAAPPLVDRSLCADIPDDTTVHRVRGLVLPRAFPSRVRQAANRWLFTVDEALPWLPAAVRRASQLLESGTFSQLYSTSAPYTDHLVALALRRRFRLPWVADFRDPWVYGVVDRFPTPLHRRICRQLEAAVIREADRVLVVSRPMQRLFRQHYPDVDPAKFLLITNGYDPDDYEEIPDLALPPERFHLVYTGSLYGIQRARYVLQAVHRLRAAGRLSAADFRLWFVGAYGAETEQVVDELGLRDMVELVRYVPHHAVIGHQLAADALLLIIGESPRSEIFLNGKLFEYLRAGVPILATIPPGAAADLIRAADAGRIVAPADVDAIAAGLAELQEQWQQGLLARRTISPIVQQFDRRVTARTLAQVFDECSRLDRFGYGAQ